MLFYADRIVFIVLSVLSHIGTTFFLAKPRFGKIVTVAIWILYGVIFMILPPNMPTVSYFISFTAHIIIFFATTVGRKREKGFLFFSYSCIYTCISTMFSIISMHIHILPWKIVLAVGAIVLLQVLIYTVLLPAIRKVTPYIHTDWGKFYAVVLGFLALIVVQSVFSMMLPMTIREIIIFVLTMLAFCITYTAVFSSMKNMAELARERQKQTHAQLLFEQVQSQAKEAEFIRQNRHDMRHHYQMMLAYADKGELGKLKDYLERQTERIENMTTGRFCENETVNSILKVYKRKAEEQNIAIEIRAAAKPSISATAPDLVAIVANILENAFHGAIESGSQTPFINVNIKHQAQRFVVNCENSCSPRLEFNEMPEYLWGIGIHSIIATADNYNGTCLFSAKNGVFRCTVVMDE